MATSPLRHSSGGQALIEFAIIGSLALLALAFLIQIGLRMNYQQAIEQQTFRLALWEAKNEDLESPATQYVHFRDRQLPNPAQGFGLMPRTLTQGSGTVTWGEELTYLGDDPSSQSRIIVDLNGAKAEFRAEDMRQIAKDGGGDCQAYFYDCIEDCDDGDEDCRDECKRGERDQCESLPLVRHIHKGLQSDGEVRQDRASSSLRSTTTEDTTLTLNTRRGDAVGSVIDSKPVSLDWDGGAR